MAGCKNQLIMKYYREFWFLTVVTLNELFTLENLSL